MHSKPANRFARAHCLAAMALGLLAVMPARAALEPDGSDDNAFRALGAQYAGRLVWILGTNSSGTSYHASGVRLNSFYVLTAAHLTPATARIYYVGNGTNYLAADGQSSAVESTLVYPGFPNDGNFNTPDIAILKLAQPLPGIDLSIASASVGQVLTSAGFGRAATPSGGLMPIDGNSRGFQAPISSLTPVNVSGDYYWDLTFAPALSGSYLNGRGTSGDSGGGAFDSNGNLVGLIVAVWSGLDPIGGTDVLKLAHPDVYAWIQNNITPVEPQILSLTREGTDMRLVWQGKAGSNYVVQAARALGGTNVFTDLSAPIPLPGVGAVTTNYLDVGALTNQAARFYRIRLN